MCVCVYVNTPVLLMVYSLCASEYVPTLQAAPPWQPCEGQVFANTAEGGDGGSSRQADPLVQSPEAGG